MPCPFYNQEFEFTQPDGTQIKLKGWGNQNHAVFETLDGFTVVKNPVTGYYQYAKLSHDKYFLEPSGAAVGSVNPASLGIEKHIRASKAAVRGLERAAFRDIRSVSRWEQRRLQQQEATRMDVMSRGLLKAPPREGTKGDYVGLCILVQFPDVPGTIPKSEVEKFCNMKGYKGYGNSGSVHDYYSEISGGKVNYTNIVTEYYTANYPREYYTNPAIKQPARTLELIFEAIEDLKAKEFDFSSITADKNGYIYALNIFYAGPVVNNWNEGLWPHCWYLNAPLDVGDGRKIYDYQITYMGSELTLRVFCHENGHMICSFPDLYDYGGQSYGVGNYCLMGYGGDEKNPVHVGAYLKTMAGWAENVIILTEDGIYTARAESNEFFKIAKNLHEYYLIECRNRENRDKSIPSSGLSIWHVDELGKNENEQMTPSMHYECSIIQADNLFHLEHMKNLGDKNDLFNNLNSPRFGDATKPNSRWWDGTSSGLEILDIGAAGKEITFRFHGNPVIKKTSNPAKAIPDKDRNGITDKIIFDEDAVISSLKVNVDITHAFRGDLKVTLISPSGDRALLHDRKGSSKDLKTTFDVSSVKDLGNMIGKSMKGEWNILVQDFDITGTGTLNSWGMEIGYQNKAQGSSVIEMEDVVAEIIPDKDEAGIIRSMTLTAPGLVKSVEVAIDITHTYIGDLKVTLVSPKGTSVILHNKFGAGQDNLRKTYSASSTSDLEKLSGEPIEGKWTLKVADLAKDDIGKLNRWSIKIVPL